MARRKGNGLNEMRSLLYLIARLLGDINAVQKGNVGKRMARRAVGKAGSGFFGRLFK